MRTHERGSRDTVVACGAWVVMLVDSRGKARREMRHWTISESHWGHRTVWTNLVPLPGGSFPSSIPELDLAVSLSLGGHWLFLLLLDPFVVAFAMNVPIFAALVAHVSVIVDAWAFFGGMFGLPPMVAAVRFGGLRRIACFLHLDLMVGDGVLPCVEGVL